MRKLTKTVVHKGNVYPAGTPESDIDNASKIGADVWSGGSSASTKATKDDDSGPAGYDALKVADLKAEIEKRNKGRDDADLLPVDGKKAELVAALTADDEKSADSTED